MWPFTSRRIFASRWWALGFVAFVCWQVAEIFGPPTPQANVGGIAPGQGSEQIDQAQVQAIADSLNNMQSAE